MGTNSEPSCRFLFMLRQSRFNKRNFEVDDFHNLVVLRIIAFFMFLALNAM